MRTTERIMTCDRCGLTEVVTDWTFKELEYLANGGWTCYASSTPDKPHTYNSSYPNEHIKDLCPLCTTEMKHFMVGSVGTYIRVSGANGAGHGRVFPTTFDATGVRIADMTDADDVILTDMRKNINSELRRRRT
jgi:hypothetical protein